MTENQRKFPRKSIQVEVELSYLEDNACTVNTRDISQCGLFMQLANPEHYPMGEMVNLHFKNPLADDEETFKDGVIVRRDDDGIAVAFVEMEEF